MSTTANTIRKYTGPWTETQLRHLLRRTLFGVTAAEYAFFKDKSMEECAEVLLRRVPKPCPPLFDATEDEGMIVESNSFVFGPENDNKDKQTDYMSLLKGWWASQIIEPQDSITEKMIFFWHNHFAVEFNKVPDVRYDYQYLDLLRQYATGNFKKLLREITTNPCMLVYLDGHINNKMAPNENYGRELQELFAIGKGPDSHYTESDVKAAARVLSGWKDDKVKITSYFDPADHDTDDKTFSAFYQNRKIKGRAGEDGTKETDELIDMICANPEVSKFLCRKLYRWFVNSNIDAKVESSVIGPLAEILRASDYEIKPVLKAIFTSDFFYDPVMVGSVIKSPVDFLLGIIRQFIIPYPDRIKRITAWSFVPVLTDILGQNMGDPPTVAGWPAYYEYPLYDKNWISSEHYYFRNQMVRFFIYLKNDVDHLLEIEFLSFVTRLPNPGDAKALVSDSLDRLCTIRPGEKQVADIELLLGPDSWPSLWASYEGNPANEEQSKEVVSRLRKVFGSMLMSPEFQIM